MHLTSYLITLRNSAVYSRIAANKHFLVPERSRSHLYRLHYMSVKWCRKGWCACCWCCYWSSMTSTLSWKSSALVRRRPLVSTWRGWRRTGRRDGCSSTSDSATRRSAAASANGRSLPATSTSQARTRCCPTPNTRPIRTCRCFHPSRCQYLSSLVGWCLTALFSTNRLLTYHRSMKYIVQGRKDETNTQWNNETVHWTERVVSALRPGLCGDNLLVTNRRNCNTTVVATSVPFLQTVRKTMQTMHIWMNEVQHTQKWPVWKSWLKIEIQKI